MLSNANVDEKWCYTRLDSWKRHKGCVIQGLIANKALILWGRLMGKQQKNKKTLFLRAPLVAIGAQK